MANTKKIRVEVAGESLPDLFYDRSLNVYYFYVKDKDTGRRKRVSRRNKAKAALDLYNYKLSQNEQNKGELEIDKNEVKSIQAQKTKRSLEFSHTEEYSKIIANYPNWTNNPKQRKECDAELRAAFKFFNKYHRYSTKIPENYVIERFVEMLDMNPRHISETFIKMGRDDLAGIIHLPKNYKVIRHKLSDILRWYLEYEPRKRDTIRYSTSFWKHFCNVIAVPHLEQITLAHVKAYKKVIDETIRKKKLSRNYASTRYEYIRRIIKHSKLHIEDKTDINRVLDNMNILKKSYGTSRKQPTPITPKEFNIFLDYVTEEYHSAINTTKIIRYAKWKAILLTAANTCSYFKDLIDMEFAPKEGELGLNLDKNTLAMYREKSSIAKIAVLWEETVDAINEYRNILNVESNYVFATKNNRQNTASHLRDEFWRHIRPGTEAKYPKLKPGIQFNSIRDACFTACASVQLPIDQRNFIAGHKNSGDDDDYLLRQPHLAKPASDACYKYFFGKKS